MLDRVRPYLMHVPRPLVLAVRYAYSMIPLRYRMDRAYFEMSELLQASQWWEAGELQAYQNAELAALLRHAYENVPFYRELFDGLGLRPADIHDAKALRRLPLLTKQEIKSRREDFLSRACRHRDLELARTSGTSGAPLFFWREQSRSAAIERAFFERMWAWHGYHRGDRSVYITGALRMGDRFQYEPTTRTLVLQNPVVTPAKVAEYMEVIRRFRPKAMRGYPTLMYAFARLINRYGPEADCPSLEVIFTNSEKLYGYQREEIAAAFRCKVVDSYGHAERLALMQQCEAMRGYHVIQEYGLVEFIGRDGEPVSEGEAEVVATGFHSRAYPMIRYRTGDWVRLSAETGPCPCGRSYPRVDEIVGRTGDYIVAPSGRLLSPTVLEFVMMRSPSCRDLQIVQTGRDTLEVLMVPDDGFAMEDAERFVAFLRSLIGEPMTVRPVLVDGIERPAGAKHSLVRSLIAREHLAQV